MRLPGVLLGRVLAVVVLLAGLAATWVAWATSRDRNAVEDEARFRVVAERLRITLLDRLHRCEVLLHGAKQLFSASEHVDRDEWRAFASGLLQGTAFPEVQGLAFIRYVPSDELDSFLQRSRQSDPNFELHPLGDRPDYRIIEFIEPAARNARAIGFDAGTTGPAKDAMDRAWWSGEAAMTAPLRLVQDRDRINVVIYLPVYQGGDRPDSRSERRIALLGWIGVPLQLGALMEALREQAHDEVSFELYDGEQIQGANRLREREPPETRSGRPSAALPHKAHFASVEQIRFGGQTWTLACSATRHFLSPQQSRVQLLIGFGGLTLSMLLCWLVLTLSNTRWRAVELAQQMTASLRTSEAEARKLATVAARTTNAVIITDAAGRIEWVNDGFTRLTEYTLEEVRGKRPGSFLQGPDTDPAAVGSMRRALQSGHGFHVEVLNYTRSGRRYWVDVEVQPTVDANGQITQYMAVETDITARKDAEAELTRAIQRFDLMVSGSRVGLWDADVPLVDTYNLQNPVYWSPQLKALLGFEDHELPNILGSWVALIHEDDRDRILATLDAHLFHGQPYDVEYRMYTKSREVRWYHACGKVLCNEQGQPLRFAGSFTDITPRKQAELALRASERLAQGALNGLSSHIAILDADGRIVAVNKSWEDFARENPPLSDRTGIGTDYLEVCDRAAADAVEDAVIFGRAIRAVLRGDLSSFEREYPCPSPANDRWFVARVTRFSDDGPPMAVVAHENITARKLSELALREREAQLAKWAQVLLRLTRQEALLHGNLQDALRGLTEAGAEALEIERVSVWVFTNDRAAITCLDQFDRSAGRHSQCQAIDATHCPAYFEALQADVLIAADDAYNDPRTAELQPYLAANRVASMLDVPVRLRGQTVGVVCHEHVGHPRHWTLEEQNFAASLAAQVSLSLETFERQRTEQELKDHAAALEAANQSLEAYSVAVEAANRAKTEFLANMSHEIRTPMTAILGYADLLLTEADRQQLSPEYMHSLQIIQRNGEHLLGIINDVLDLSKIEVGQLRVEQLAFSPSRIIADVAALMRLRAEARGLAFAVTFDGSMPESIDSDPTRFRQILINLVGNAIKFTEQGSVRIEARCVVDHNTCRGRLEVSVVDTGIGMTPEQIDRVFHPFMQADTSMTRRFGGTGLGLAISMRLAELLGGRLAVESQPGIGSTFRLTIDTGSLAATRMIDGLDSSGTAPLVPSPELASLAGARILLAEDGIDNQRLLDLILRKAGADVTLVDDGQKAVDAVLAAWRHGQAFDLVLMDMQMPVLDGYAATRLLRAEGYGGTVVALTAHVMAGEREKCQQAGCNDYATKPIDRPRLLAQLRAVLDQGPPSAQAPPGDDSGPAVAHQVQPNGELSGD